MSDISDDILFRTLVCLFDGCCFGSVNLISYYVAQISLVCVAALPQPFMLK